ncbi:domain of unknown function DUF1731 [Pseudopedobacter saltans DSM 12145]|uniref:Uncharacterized protein n=1 Tax=Pseudopedobacter saltans (strain ATCC 51119 / DSM 12145 / JCM 21818 / CCUG 39354 / LMG 10337 / NBRC 100064 / NCIMB 13643) TaxID=762903 RepID=F0S9Z3_PSESL|nr:TIGR01777 family oxidoreductase [Pseudopedobacter saltans]ADY52551.1 domain of unknown function DUF1731 [Pseudopedobacter saltans DSM 12145]
MAKVVLAGGTGNLGVLLSEAFLNRGDEVLILTRQRNAESNNGLQYVFWDGETIGTWIKHIERADVIINLSGQRIDRRFTDGNKAILEKSRLLPTQIIGSAIQQLQYPPKLWINFSGISIFSDAPSGFHDEDGQEYGTGFLAYLTQKWENAVHDIILPSTRKVILRVSPVLLKDTGMFSELYLLTKWGLGGKVGNGKQYISWIHEQDFIALVFWLIAKEPKDAIYHACTPFPVTNTAFMEQLRQSAGVGLGIPIPAIFARVGALIKGVDASLLLSSTQATTKKTIVEGFKFKYPSIQQAFSQLIK